MKKVEGSALCVLIDGESYSQDNMAILLHYGLWFKMIDETLTFSDLWTIFLIKKGKLQ
jgi:hypothetical protein